MSAKWKDHIEHGLCQSCGAIAVPHKTYCEKHLMLKRKTRNALRAKLIMQGLCPRCGRLLNRAIDGIGTECIICRNPRARVMIHANCKY